MNLRGAARRRWAIGFGAVACATMACTALPWQAIASAVRRCRTIALAANRCLTIALLAGQRRAIALLAKLCQTIALVAKPCRTIALLALVACAAPVWAQGVGDGEPLGDPQPGKSLSDRDFGVSTRQFGLDRRVEMYQWRRDVGIATQGDGYQRVWNAAPIDSSGFTSGYVNPPRMPLENKRWWSESATLDGKPLGDEVLRAVGEWRVFRPNFSRLPANLAATFQPEGDGLGSSENPLDPQIGDLRVIWRELRLPSLEGKLVLRDGVWHLRPEAIAAALNPSPGRERAIVAGPEPEDRRWSPGWFALAVVLALGLLYRLRRRRKSQAGAPPPA